MTDITTTARIERPAAVVFDHIADMEKNPSWQRGQQRCIWTSEPPLRVGSTYDQVARFLGRELRSSFEVTELEPGRRIRIVTTGGSMPIDVTRSVEPLTDEACEVTARVRGEPPRAMRLLGPLLDRLVRRSVRQDYERLREQLEAEADR
ncbi:MAG: SRPBCC family protein [Actinomycetota bacterium]